MGGKRGRWARDERLQRALQELIGRGEAVAAAQVRGTGAGGGGAL